MAASGWLYLEQNRHTRQAVAISAAATEGGRALRVRADAQLAHARGQAAPDALDSALRRGEAKTTRALEVLAPVDRTEDLAAALQDLRAALA